MRQLHLPSFKSRLLGSTAIGRLRLDFAQPEDVAEIVVV